MKMYEEINHLKKGYVYERYTRIVHDFKDYDKITKVKMLDAIYDVYRDYNNIIDVCTTRELKYLKMVLDNKLTIDDLLKNPNELKIEYLDEKYNWERENLRHKFLLDYDYYKESHIPEEILDNVKAAIKNVNWKEQKKIDELNEIIVGYCKVQGSALLNTVASFGSGITGLSEDVIWKHMLSNKLFNYYVYIVSKDFDSIGNNIPVAIHQDYYEIEEELEKQRRLQGLAGDKQIDIRIYKRLFYNDFDIQNPKIKKFLDELQKLPFFWFSAIKPIREFAMLNIDRSSLKKSIQSVPALQYHDLTNFFKIMDEAMDEMPSGALNGFTPNEAKELKVKQVKKDIKKNQSYVKQQNACLSKKDSKLFYKIYFGLLEFTNKKYKINNMKIYNQHGINPYELKGIVDKFWENKDAIVLEFCLVNPYKFNKEELEITSEFKKGIRGMFIIAKYDLEYTAFMEKDKVYMVKGLNDNIDNIISYKDLPYVVVTSVIPFKNVLTYDGMLLGMGVKMGNGFDDIVEKEYDNMMKYYHL